MISNRQKLYIDIFELTNEDDKYTILYNKLEKRKINNKFIKIMNIRSQNLYPRIQIII